MSDKREQIVTLRYAQEKGGQQLHLVQHFPPYVVASRALCGRHPAHNWRMTINVPLGHACKNCVRVFQAYGGRS